MDTTLVLFLAGYGGIFAVGALGWREVRAFVESTPSIGDGAALERFKTVARHNMYGALAQIALGAIGVIASFWVIAGHGLAGFLGVAAGNALLFLGASRMKALELRAQALPTASDALAAQQRRIVETWRKRPFPDF
jgi:hypothetical protein